MKILFLHSNTPDYLAESLFHGLRSLLGENCVDLPRYDALYSPLSETLRGKLRGNGFTLYGLLPELPALADQRYFWEHDLASYDLVIVASLWRQKEMLWRYRRLFRGKTVVFLDGEDTPRNFPAVFPQIREMPSLLFFPFWNYPCYKREWHSDLSLFSEIRPISFSIPEEKIVVTTPADKSKDFTRHIVDPEVEKLLKGEARGQYAFDQESDYEEDLRISRFGVTMKRAGWDCLRHYELASKGCVLCFRDFDRKPVKCAPHGLDDSFVVSYRDADELLRKVRTMSEEEYAVRHQKTIDWARENGSLVRAKAFLKTIFP